MAWYFKGYPVGGELRAKLALVTSLEVLRGTLDQLDLDAPYPGADAEGQRGRAGTPKKPALPKDWLLNRTLDDEQPATSPSPNWTSPVAETRTTAPVLDGYTSRDSARWVEEPPKSTYRSDFARDRARVLHSSALRRLGAKTQVLAPDTADFARNRLTHTLEVAQVGRELGRALGCDPDVVDTACLSHDLGHPPFGHNGEARPQRVGRGDRRLRGQRPDAAAADPARAEGPRPRRPAGRPQPHPGEPRCRRQVPVVRRERARHPRRADQQVRRLRGRLAVFDWIRDGAPERRSCLEAQVMDLSDDIAYSVHDFEDAIVAGYFQLRWMDNPDHRARVVGYAKQWYLPHNDPAAIDAALARLEATDVWVREADGSRKAMAALKNMTSQLIGRFARARSRPPARSTARRT